MINMSLRYYFTLQEFGLRECSVSDDGESQSSNFVRLSFILLNFLRKDEVWSQEDELLNAKYLLQGFDAEYSSLQYAF